MSSIFELHRRQSFRFKAGRFDKEASLFPSASNVRLISAVLRAHFVASPSKSFNITSLGLRFAEHCGLMSTRRPGARCGAGRREERREEQRGNSAVLAAQVRVVAVSSSERSCPQGAPAPSSQ